MKPTDFIPVRRERARGLYSGNGDRLLAVLALVLPVAVDAGESKAHRVVKTLRLSRSVASERWHYPLLADRGRGVVAKNNLTPGRHPLPKSK